MPPESRLVVVDASVALKWQLDDEECVVQATSLRDDYYARGAVKVIAPQLLVYELANGIATATRKKRIAPEQAVRAMANLLALEIELRAVEPLEVLNMALRHNLAAYDAAYLALAESEKCELWTGDKAFHKAMTGQSSRVKWIGEYPGSSAD